MAKFDKVARKTLMVRFQEIDGKTGVWATCSQAVKDYAEKTFKAGEEVDVQSDASGEVGLYVTRISKPGQGGGAVSTKPTTGTVPKCEDCGAELKDAKYKKCWTCNQKKPVKRIDSDGNFRTPEQLRRDEIGHMVAKSLVSMQGQVDPNNIVGLIETLYKKYQELVG